MEDEKRNDNSKDAPPKELFESVRSNDFAQNILSEAASGRQTELNNNEIRYTEVDNDIMFKIEGFEGNNTTNISTENSMKNTITEEKNEKKTDQNGILNNNNKSPLYNTNKQVYNFKVIVLGDIAVGKTSVIGRYITNTFTEVYKSSIGCEFKKKKIDIDEETQVNLQIWDTAGEERFMSVTKQYYNDSHGAMVIYDLTNKNSFIKMNNWINDVKNNAPKNITIMVVGNKSDLINEKVDLGDELKPFKDNYLYCEVSAKNGINVSLAFENLALKIIEKQKEKGNEENTQRDSVPLKKISIHKKPKKCHC